MSSYGCDLCLSESPNDPEWLRKAVERRKLIEQKQSNPFKLEVIPKHLQSMILTKMDQTSFTRMRRTNNHFSLYIDKNRHSLNIALFHNCSIRFEADDCVYLSKPGYGKGCFIIGNNFRDDASEEPEISSIDFEKPNFTNGWYGNEVKLYLKAFKQDQWLQKELTGVIKLCQFSINHKPVDDTYSTFFLTSQNIESFSLDVSTGSSQLINLCLQTLNPTKLDFKVDKRIRQGRSLETRVDWNYNYLRNVHILSLIDPSNMPNSFDVMKMLKMWCLGESNLRVMTYSTSAGAYKIPLFLLNGEKIDEFRTGWIVSRGPLSELAAEAFPEDLEMNKSDPPEAYKLMQKSTQKRALAFFYGNHVLFTIAGDRLLEAIPKKPRKEDV